MSFGVSSSFRFNFYIAWKFKEQTSQIWIEWFKALKMIEIFLVQWCDLEIHLSIFNFFYDVIIKNGTHYLNGSFPKLKRVKDYLNQIITLETFHTTLVVIIEIVMIILKLAWQVQMVQSGVCLITS